jgi:MraZ protein
VTGRFLGEYQHSLDAKGRVILPARFRDDLPGRAVLTSQHDGCLAVWSPEAFEEKAAEWLERAKGGPTDRQLARVFFASAQEFDLTGQGRINIPPALRDFAGLAVSEGVVVTGMYDHIEIWNATRWQQTREAGDRELAAGQP